MHRPILKSLVMASALALAAAACSSSPASSGKQAKPLVIVDNTGQTYTRSFNPFVSTSLGNEVNSTALYYEPLLLFNIMRPTQPPIPWLATAYSWSDGGKTLTLTIRKGVRFSDGTPMTASDVAFSFSLLKLHPNLTPVAPPPVPLTATATSPTTVVLRCSQPEYANLVLIGGIYVGPEHTWKGIANPATFTDPNPVGTGPYVVSQFSAQKFTLTPKDRKSTRLNSSHTVIYTLSLHDALPILEGHRQPGDVHRSEPGRHRAVRGVAVLGAEVHPHAQQALLGQGERQGAVDRLPGLHQQRHGEPGP